MAGSDAGDSRVYVITSSFSVRAALYEHLFQFDRSVHIEEHFSAVEGKDVLVIACNNSYGLPSERAREALRYEFIFLRSLSSSHGLLLLSNIDASWLSYFLFFLLIFYK